MFLEIFGYCKLLRIDSFLDDENILQYSLDWDILPKGEYPWINRNTMLNFVKKISKKNIPVIERRFEVLKRYNPDFCAVGTNSFDSYMVYGYTDKSIYIFESNQINNATYIFQSNWLELSKLTKADIIRNKLYYKRIIHDNRWDYTIDEIFNI